MRTANLSNLLPHTLSVRIILRSYLTLVVFLLFIHHLSTSTYRRLSCIKPVQYYLIQTVVIKSYNFNFTMPISQTRSLGNPDSFCESCYRQFSSSAKLAEHFRNSSTHSQSFCSTCQMLFPDTKALLKHQKSSSKHHFCHPCGLDFASSEKLNVHYAHSSNHHFCTLCQELFVDSEALTRHVDRHHWNCDKCGVYFASVRYLKSHYKDTIGHAYCEKCDEGFCDKAELERHMMMSDNHSICVMCKKDVGSAEKLNKVNHEKVIFVLSSIIRVLYSNLL